MEVSCVTDWNTVAQNTGGSACYILFELAARSWITITFVPAGTKVGLMLGGFLG